MRAGILFVLVVGEHPMTVSALTQFDPSHFFQAPVSAPQRTQR